MELISLPSEMLFEILLNLRGVDLLNFCLVNKSLQYLCNEQLWQQKTLLDFNHSTKPPYLSWIQYYIQLNRNNIKQIDISIYEWINVSRSLPHPLGNRGLKRISLGPFWITKQDTLKNIILNAISLYKLTPSNDIRLRDIDNNIILIIEDVNLSIIRFLDPHYPQRMEAQPDPQFLNNTLDPYLWNTLDHIILAYPDNPIFYP